MQHQHNILIADSNEQTGMALRDTLRAAGYKAYWVIDGVSAIDRIVDFTPDLIILDTNIPELDFLETCETIKAMPELSHTLLIAQGNRPSRKHYDDTRKVGFDFFLTKPITVETVEMLLKQIEYPRSDNVELPNTHSSNVEKTLTV